MHPFTKPTVNSITIDDVNTLSNVPAPRRSKSLTPRETEIVRLVVRGLTNKEIALALDISHWTVATHLRRIYDKTRVKRRAALIAVLVVR